MIQTTVEQLDRYTVMHPRFKQAYEALRAQAQEPFSPGRIPVNGEEIYINALAYYTKSEAEAQFEAHKVYYDVMLVLSGEESIACLPGRVSKEITSEYNEAGDCYLAEMEHPHSTFSMKPGDIAIFYPGEMHAPGLYAEGKSGKVTKFVMKVMAQV